MPPCVRLRALGVICVARVTFASSLQPRSGVGKFFTRRARFGKTVEGAGRTLIGKQGEDFFLEITVHTRM